MEETCNYYTDLIRFECNHTSSHMENYSLHCHNFYEFYYFLNGTVEYLVEGVTYYPTPNSLLLLPPGVFHGVKVYGDVPYNRYALHFLPEAIPLEYRKLLSQIFPILDKNNEKQIYYENLEEFGFDSFFQNFITFSKMSKDLQQLALQPYLCSLLLQIIYMKECRNETIHSSENLSLVEQIIHYLNENLASPIYLEDLSKRFFISKNQINRIFQKATGTTMKEYLIYKRVIHAQQLLTNGYSAGEACSASGFLDYSSFYRAYKKITGHSPAQDRNILSFTSTPKPITMVSSLQDKELF